MVYHLSDANLLKTVAARGSSHQGRAQLQRFDWLQQALDIFVSEGIAAVRITRLAEDLGVTRGSFYWHFENREDLVGALVEFWQSKNTPALGKAVGEAHSLADGIFRFFEICIDTSQFDPRLDLAIREWSRRSDTIRALVDREDQARIELLRSFFTRFGFGMPLALVRARVLYYAQIGFYALEVQEPLSTRLEYTEAYYECFTGQRLRPTEAEQFRQYILETYGDQLA